MSELRQRAGFAVATAVFALVVVGALAIGTFFAATHEFRSGFDAIHQTRALMAADFGLEQTLAGWRREWNGTLGRGYARVWTASTPEGAVITVTLTRLADALFRIASEARAGPARRAVSRVVRLDIAEPSPLAAIASSAPIDLSSSAGVDGSDRAPALWDCGTPGPAVPPVAIADTTALNQFGQFDWSAIVRVANARVSGWIASVAPRGSGQECDISAAGNWGEPARSNGGPCTGYYPIIHAPGDLTLDGGRGQGVLVVDGNLTLSGGFDFSGAVLVRGALRAGAGGARISGAVVVAGHGVTTSDITGIAVQYSRCAARHALLDVALPVPVIERSWSPH